MIFPNLIVCEKLYHELLEMYMKKIRMCLVFLCIFIYTRKTQGILFCHYEGWRVKEFNKQGK